jgi:hypothetical protein
LRSLSVRSASGDNVSACFLVVGPLTARPAAAGGYARLVRIVSLLDRISVPMTDPERLENGARDYAGLHCVLGYEQPICCSSKVTWCMQPAMRQVDVSEASIAVPPGFYGAFDVAQHRRGHGLPVCCSQQGKDLRFLAAQTLQATWPLRLEEYRAGTQH